MLNNFGLLLVACLTLGLAPFLPEPHIVGKIRWVLGGAHGMTGMDWFDLFLHGIPWLLMLRFILRFVLIKTKLIAPKV